MAIRCLSLIVGFLILARDVDAQEMHQLAANRLAAIEKALDRSLKLLADEVPLWLNEHHCASCHNQGDAAVALIEASRHKLVDLTPLQSTLDWLAVPNKWSTNRGLPEASDQQLANLQFAGALLSACESDHAKYQLALDDAAKLLAADQAEDGSWKIVSGGSLASPITHGELLLSGTAIEVIRASGLVDKTEHIARAEKWLAQLTPRNTLEAASLMIAIPRSVPNRESLTGRCSSLILRSQDEQSGGWGPHGNAAPEVFDTALVVMALQSIADKNQSFADAINRGIDYLTSEQSDDGSWPETTRPSNTVSYAHRISTTAWAARALMAVSKPRN